MVERAVLSWPGISAQPHRFDGTEFRAHGHEIGHLHGSWQADLPFPARMREELVATGRASPHHSLPQTGWVTYYISGTSDAAAGVDLFRQHYERVAGQRGPAQEGGAVDVTHRDA
jgi:hypothetical protein